LGEFLSKKKSWLKIIFIILLLLLTLPTTIGDLKNYLGSQAPAKIGFQELDALAFLRKQPQGVVLTYPHNYRAREKTKEVPKPLYIYETTAYVSAFANQQTFLEDEMTLEIMQFDWETRRKEVEKFFKTTELLWAKDFLNENQIRYLYLVDNQSFFINPDGLELEEIFANDFVKIYEFRDKI